MPELVKNANPRQNKYLRPRPLETDSVILAVKPLRLTDNTEVPDFGAHLARAPSKR